jgi:steroid delta-isomerase
MRELLDRHVDFFNSGVRTGDFAPMIEQFTADAELHFEGVPVGPFVGRNVIAEAYKQNPPDDEIDILDVEEEGSSLVARYAWKKDGGRAAGRMIITARDGRIARLIVTFD